MLLQPSILNINFSPLTDKHVAINAMTADDLQRRGTTSHFERLRRGAFFRLVGVCHRKPTLTVGCSSISCKARHWLLIHPGQVIRYDFSKPWAGWNVAFQPCALFDKGHDQAADASTLMDHVKGLPCAHMLGRACAAATGWSAKTYITRRLISTRKRLLAHTQKSVQPVGNELGFKAPSNYIKFLRRGTATTPSASRQAPTTASL
jgi:hypothetical protein